VDSTPSLHVNDSRSSGRVLGLGPLEYEKDIGHWMVIFELLTCIHRVLHINKCTKYISYISLKLYTLKHFHCSYMFR
jgi:hypothetical protein